MFENPRGNSGILQYYIKKGLSRGKGYFDRLESFGKCIYVLQFKM